MSLTTFRTSALLASLLTTAIDLTQALPTLPVFVPDKEPGATGPDTPTFFETDTPSLLSVLRARGHVSATDGLSLEARDERQRRRSELAAIIGGTVAAGVMLAVAVFFVFAIYKQYLLRQEQLRKEALQDGCNSTYEDNKNRESLFQRVSCFFRRPVLIPTPEDDPDSASVYSNDSSSAESTTAQVGMLNVEDEPDAPGKAAKVLGLGDRAWRPRRDSTPQPPLGTVLEERSLVASKRRSSGCTMSTLGMELLRDTMQMPEPQKFMSNPIPQAPWKPRHEREPSQDLDAQSDSRESRRYFIPMMSPGSPESMRATERGFEMNKVAPEATRAEQRISEASRAQRRAKNESRTYNRYSMGDNKF